MKPDKQVRNEIYDAVVSGGLDPRECDFDYHDEWARVTHRPSASYLDLNGNILRWVATPVIGDRVPIVPAPFNWLDLEEHVRGWAEQVRRDYETPDKWAEIERDDEILTGVRYVAVQNTPFTAAERAQIAEQLEQIRRSAQTAYALSEAKMELLAAKLDEVLAASGRMGRKDWAVFFGGVMLTVIVTDLLPPSAVQDILVSVLHALEHLFGADGGPPLLA
jgi:hypothetical protein